MRAATSRWRRVRTSGAGRGVGVAGGARLPEDRDRRHDDQRRTARRFIIPLCASPRWVEEQSPDPPHVGRRMPRRPLQSSSTASAPPLTAHFAQGAISYVETRSFGGFAYVFGVYFRIVFEFPLLAG